jgi:hypothetical protein
MRLRTSLGGLTDPPSVARRCQQMISSPIRVSSSGRAIEESQGGADGTNKQLHSKPGSVLVISPSALVPVLAPYAKRPAGGDHRRRVAALPTRSPVSQLAGSVRPPGRGTPYRPARSLPPQLPAISVGDRQRDNATAPASKPCTQAAEPAFRVRQHERQPPAYAAPRTVAQSGENLSLSHI